MKSEHVQVKAELGTFGRAINFSSLKVPDFKILNTVEVLPK